MNKAQEIMSLTTEVTEAKKDPGVPVICIKCKAPLGNFRSFDDHSGIIIVCPKCKKDVEIENNTLLDVEENPGDWNLPLEA